MIFEGFSDEAKIWLYQANRELKDAEVQYLEKQLSNFVDQWSAHGNKLKASSQVLDSYRFAICADGSVEASGCSIDASVRFMKEMGAELGVDFFNRMQILSDREGQKEFVAFSELKNNPELEIYHPAITNLKELRSIGKLKVKEYLGL